MRKIRTNLKAIARIPAAIDSLSRLMGLSCGIICLLMALVVISEVVARRFFHNPLGWPFELNTFLLVALSFLGGAFTLLVGGHVKVDVLYIRLSRRTQLILDLCTSVLALSYLIWLDWLVFGAALRSLRMGEVSLLQEWPMFPVRLLLPIGTSLLIVQLLVEMGRKFVTLKKLNKG